MGDLGDALGSGAVVEPDGSGVLGHDVEDHGPADELRVVSQGEDEKPGETGAPVVGVEEQAGHDGDVGDGAAGALDPRLERFVSAPSPDPARPPSRVGAALSPRDARPTHRRCRVTAPESPTVPVDQDKLTRAQKAMLALSNEVATQLAEDHGVCTRPLAMRRIDQTTGRVDVVPVPCGSTREDQCRPCAEKARRLRMVQCREGWHLEDEPIAKPADASAAQKELMTVRADLHAAYTDARTKGDEEECEEIRETVAEVDAELRALGVRGRLAPLDPTPQTVRRSTRRRQDAPNLPRRPVEDRMLGRVFGGKYRPPRSSP